MKSHYTIILIMFILVMLAAPSYSAGNPGNVKAVTGSLTAAVTDGHAETGGEKAGNGGSTGFKWLSLFPAYLLFILPLLFLINSLNKQEKKKTPVLDTSGRSYIKRACPAGIRHNYVINYRVRRK